jgi:hypothetical protein
MAPRAFSLVGLLITMGCIVVLFAVLMTAMNRSVTGEGSARLNTVRSMEDQLRLVALVQAMNVHAAENRDRYLVPSTLAGSDDRGLNTTANLFSAMVALRYVRPEDLISANEYSGFVEPCWDYDYRAYSPVNGRYWDPSFKADLRDLSHVSFAHPPLHGERHERYWRATMSGTFPIFGNRGPKDGVENPQSATYGRSGQWGGHLAFGDGHVEFITTFSPPGSVWERGGTSRPDNVFALEDGPGGSDAILAFTRRMTRDGPELQWD